MSLLLDALKQAEQSRKQPPNLKVEGLDLQQHEKPDQYRTEEPVTSVIENDMALGIKPEENHALPSANSGNIPETDNKQNNSIKLETKPEQPAEDRFHGASAELANTTKTAEVAQEKHPTQETTAEHDQARLIAQNVFAVKQHAASKTSPLIKWGGGIIILLASTIIALFFLSQHSSVQAINSINEIIPADIDSPTLSIKSETPDAQQIAKNPDEPTKTIPPLKTHNTPKTLKQKTHTANPAFVETIQPAPEQSSGIKIIKKRVKPKVHGLLTQAFSQLKSGNIGGAEQNYRRLLTIEPDQIDALLGLANIMVQKKQFTEAYRLYQQILKRQPDHLLAKIGLININLQNGQTVQTLNHIKQLIFENPENATLHIVLGDFFAHNKNWPAAQSAYFKAVSIIPDEPDYLFNLAVSLDHLNKRKAASKYYKKALKNSQIKPANFNQNSVISRLQQISANSS